MECLCKISDEKRFEFIRHRFFFCDLLFMVCLQRLYIYIDKVEDSTFFCTWCLVCVLQNNLIVQRFTWYCVIVQFLLYSTCNQKVKRNTPNSFVSPFLKAGVIDSNGTLDGRKISTNLRPNSKFCCAFSCLPLQPMHLVCHDPRLLSRCVGKLHI